MEFKLKLEFIELDNLLKAMNLAASGTEARQYILAGSIKINGQVETRIRRKLRLGDTVEFGKHQISIVAKKGDND
jgi:ribosome-associated protein